MRWMLVIATWVVFPVGFANVVFGAEEAAPKPPASKKTVNLLLNDPRLSPRDTTISQADWGQIRKTAEARFSPSRDLISDESKATLLSRQLVTAQPVAPEPAGRKLSTDPHVDAQDEVDATRRAYERPAKERDTEITVHTDAMGQVENIFVTKPSGNARFDEKALECVRTAFATYPPIEERRPFVSRFRVHAGLAVSLPRTLAPMTPRSSNARVPARGLRLPMPIWGSFDETRGTAKTEHAFSDQIERSVELLYHGPR